MAVLLGPKLKQIRRLKGLKMVDVAEQLGKHRCYIGQIENGKRQRISGDFALLLAKFYGVSADYLLDDTRPIPTCSGGFDWEPAPVPVLSPVLALKPEGESACD